MSSMSPLDCIRANVPKYFVRAFLRGLCSRNITSISNYGTGFAGLSAVSNYLRGKNEQEIGDLGSVIYTNIFIAGIFSNQYHEFERILRAEVPFVVGHFISGKGTTFSFSSPDYPISLDGVHPQIIELANELAEVFANACKG